MSLLIDTSFHHFTVKSDEEYSTLPFSGNLILISSYFIPYSSPVLFSFFQCGLFFMGSFLLFFISFDIHVDVEVNTIQHHNVHAEEDILYS